MSTPGKSRPDASGSSNWHVRLREVLESYFDENDIETLCFDLRFDYERLAGEGKTRKIVELIKEFARLGRVGELIDYCSRQRPNIQWAELREAALKNPLVVDREPDVGRVDTTPTPRPQTPSPPSPNSSKWLYAVIVLVALVLILRACWPRSPSPTPSPSPGPAGGCGGIQVAGACWYFGAENASCDMVCAPNGGYNPATRGYAGSDGSPGNCQNVLKALGVPLDNFYSTTQGGLGCFALQTTSGNYYGYWDTDPTSGAATSPTAGRRRICACQH
jgi:hypothetical protein